MKSELYIPIDGLGVINITGSETESILLIHGEPVQFCWFAEVGTLWRYHIGRSITKQIIRENYAYQRMTELGELYPNNSLSAQFGHILRLLKYAEYELSLTQFSYENDLYPPTDSEAMGCYDTYGGLFDITFTQSKVDEARVEYYRRLIRGGKRPVAVLLSLEHYFNTFVLDGHHKLMAYGREKVAAVALRIVKPQQQAIEVQAGIKLIRNMIGQHQEFEHAFLQEKQKGYFKRNFYSYYNKGNSSHFKEYDPF